MLETAIVNSGKMDVMERGRMDAVLSEQVLAQQGITDAGGQLGGLIRIDYTIYGTVTKFGVTESGLNVSSNKGVGSLLGTRHAEETEIGRAEITRAEPRFSRARMMNAQIVVEPGGILKRPATTTGNGASQRSGSEW